MAADLKVASQTTRALMLETICFVSGVLGEAILCWWDTNKGVTGHGNVCLKDVEVGTKHFCFGNVGWKRFMLVKNTMGEGHDMFCFGNVGGSDSLLVGHQQRGEGSW
jgi:hypothetical protein